MGARNRGPEEGEGGARPRALITGASSGIGEAFARELAKRGHDLVLVARRRDRLERLAGELSEGLGIAADVLAADLAKEADIAAVEERLRADEIDLLVNGAGFGIVGEFADVSLERQLEELDVDVRALMRLTHAALSAMIPRRRGGIINVASTAAFQPIPNMATYAASKAFVLFLTEAVHEEAKKHGVAVTCLCPGPVKTEFQQVAGVDRGRVPRFVWTSTDRVVESALSALRSRRAVVVPGTFNVMGAFSTRLAPRFLARRIAASWFRNTSGS